jgi:FkbM family methyltransferase
MTIGKLSLLKGPIKELILLPLTFLNLIASFYNICLKLLKPSLVYAWTDKMRDKNLKLTKTIFHPSSSGGLKIQLFTPNMVCRARANTFSTKEPETLEWIDKHGGDGVLFDIGANVGLYSIYYAASKKSNVYAFEPSVFNLAVLTKNIYANKLQDRIKIITNPLTEENQFADFSLSTIEEGGALSAFGVDYGQDGLSMSKVLSYQTMGLSLDFLMQHKILPEYPKMIKIDVDGIEHLILAGAMETLKHPTCKTVLIEVNNDFKHQSENIAQMLRCCGFSLEQRHQKPISSSENSLGTCNQIWIK